MVENMKMKNFEARKDFFTGGENLADFYKIIFHCNTVKSSDLDLIKMHRFTLRWNSSPLIG